MSRSFNKRGLRRDLNFADINNPKQSLNNLLNGLVDIEGESFISEDLDAIRELRTSTIINDDFKKIVGAATRTVNPDGSVSVYKPIIKLKNRFDVAEFTTGDPQFWGGDGLTARFYEADQINSSGNTIENIFTGTPVDTNIFWEHGRFNYQTKINENLLDIYGGVTYTGTFKPTQSGIWGFSVRTTGFYTFEFDDGLGNYELLGRKSQLEYSFVVNPASAGSTELTLQTAADARFLLEEDILVNANISQFADPENNPVEITQFNIESGSISLSAALDADILSPTTFTFRYAFGNTPGSIFIRSPNIREFRNYKIRMSFWIPDENFVTQDTVRDISYFISRPEAIASSTYFNYKWLYSENYNIDPTPGTLAYGDFKNYYDNRLSAAGGLVGGGIYNNYESVLTLNTLNVSYEPPVSLADATKRTIDLSFPINTDNISVSITDNIEVGNYVFGAGINSSTRVDDVSINTAVFIDDLTTSGQASVPITFVDHRGLGAFEASAAWSSGGTTVSGLSVNTMSNIRVGDIVVANGSPAYNRVLSKGGSSVTTSKTFSASAGSGINGTALFYRENGLYNDSLLTYCANVYSGETTASSPVSSTSITIDDSATNIAVGQVVQFGTRIPAGTTVTNIASSGGNYIITLSNALNDEIPSGQLITFAPAGTTDSKEICFPPIDTSPPFTATAEGLQTTSGRPSITIAPLAGQGELKFVGLSANNVPVQGVAVTDSFDRTITVKDGLGNTYKILATLN
jgi:hypothetical protein